MKSVAERRLVRKVVGYVVQNRELLVFTHDDLPIEVTGVQIPAGTIEPGETAEAAVVREVWEETGVTARVVADLGVENYDVWSSKPEINERHFSRANDGLRVRSLRRAGVPANGGHATGSHSSTHTCSVDLGG